MEKKTAYNAVGFCFVWEECERRELFAIFFDGNEKETTLDEKNTLIMRRLALKLDLLLRIHSLLGRQRKNSGCLFFFFVLRWT